jgi:hypothetical protein
VAKIIRTETITRKNGEVVTLTLSDLGADKANRYEVCNVTFGGGGTMRTLAAAEARLTKTAAHFRKG